MQDGKQAAPTAKAGIAEQQTVRDSLKNILVEPSCGWIYELEHKTDSGIKRVKFKSGSWFELMDDIRIWHTINRVGMPHDMDAIVQDYICQNAHPHYCKNGTGSAPLTLRELANGTKNLMRVMLSRQFVSPEEANRRANICFSCKKHSKIGGCASCILSDIGASVIKRKFKLYLNDESRVKACGVCKCALALKVFVKNEELDKLEEKYRYDYPTHCWRKEPR